ncbi:MAG TPA: hypothetical protein VMC10_15605 [Stellaceae bacterium]|nr:hypothetical protein [Stellaceae bacterium]
MSAGVATMEMPEADLLQRFESLPQLVNDDPWLLHRGRFVGTDLLVSVGPVPYYLSIARGRIIACERGPLLMRSWRFAVRGGAEAWRRHWERMPPPHYHDLFGLAKRGLVTIEGDIHPLMANLFYFKDVLSAPRRLAGAA